MTIVVFSNAQFHVVMYYSCYQCCCVAALRVHVYIVFLLLYLHFTLGLLTESDLDTLVEEMSSVNTKWESIGQGIFHSSDHEYLTDIHTSYSTSHDCMREMLRKWLQVYGTTTWGRIIRALRSAGEPKVADNLKAKYIPGELTTTT